MRFNVVKAGQKRAPERLAQPVRQAQRPIPLVDKSGARGPRSELTPFALRAVSVFAPLPWPGTPNDVAWNSSPTFGRSPSGWVRHGFFS